MEKQISFLSFLIIIIALLSVVLFAFNLWSLNNNHRNSAEIVEEAERYCGTMELPQNKVYYLDHPGLKIYNTNCKVCHSLKEDEMVVGPSLCNTSNKLDNYKLQLLLIEDNKNQLIQDKNYKQLNNKYKIGFHVEIKFEFNNPELANLVSFLDTITVLQK